MRAGVELRYKRSHYTKRHARTLTSKELSLNQEKKVGLTTRKRKKEIRKNAHLKLIVKRIPEAKNSPRCKVLIHNIFRFFNRTCLQAAALAFVFGRIGNSDMLPKVFWH